VPPTPASVATVVRPDSEDESPTRTWKSVPTSEPSVTRTPVIVAVRPMSISSPVPVCRPPYSGVAYHSVCHGALVPPSITRAAAPGSSPAPPLGPTAVTPVGRSGWDTTATGEADGGGLVLAIVGEPTGDTDGETGVVAALVCLVAAALVCLVTVVSATAATCGLWPTPEVTSYAATPSTIRITMASAADSLSWRRSRVLVGRLTSGGRGRGGGGGRGMLFWSALIAWKISVGVSSACCGRAGPCSLIIGEAPFQYGRLARA
jgi:hypothetical protein